MYNFKQTYSNMDNESLIRLAIADSKDLTDEAVEALISVLDERKAAPHIIENIRKQRREYTFEELTNIAEKYTKGICPICSKQNETNGFLFSKQIGLAVITRHEQEFLIGCRHCLKKEFNNSLLINIFICLSFSSFITMPFRVISLILQFNKVMKNFGSISKDYEQYLRKNIGIILSQIDKVT